MASPQDKLNKQLRKAAAAGDIPAMEAALVAGADIETKGGFFSLAQTPLCEATLHGKAAAVEFLLKKGANPEARDMSGDTPLLIAVAEGAPDVVAALLRHGAQADTPGQMAYKTPMGIARLSKKETKLKMISLLQKAQTEQALKKIRAREKLERSLAARQKAERDARRSMNPDVIIFEQQLSNRTIEEVYNFSALERVTFVRKEPDGPVEAVTRQNFADLGDAPGLRKAFAEHAKRGGKTPESKVFSDSFTQIKPLPRKDP